MNKNRKTSHILNVFQYDEATGIIGLNGAPVSGYGLYTHTDINDGSVGIDSSASINALYLLKNGTKQFEISYDTSGATKLFRLLPYQSGSSFQIGNPSNAANSNTDYVFISEAVYGNVLIGPGIGNAVSNLTGATAATHKIQFNGAIFANNSIQATSFKITGGASTGFLKADGTVDAVTYLSGNQSITVSGDATGSGTTAITLTLANTAVTPGTYGSTTLVPVVTVDSKGRITSVTTAAISGSLTFTGDVTGSGTTGTSTGLTLAASGVTAGTYTKVTVDSKGRVTVGANASTTDISEGTNLYYTDTRVGTYLTANSYATQSYVGTQIANLVASAPATLDTLNELSVALGNDPNFATSVATSIGTKQAQLNGTGFVKVVGTTVSYDSNTYLTSFTETDPIYVASTWYSTTNNATNWNTAYGWGNHASGGYLTSATAATTYASLTGTYANPAFISSLAYSKITGVPAFLTSYTETDPYRVTSVAVSGTSTKTITLTRADASTVTTTWTDIDTDTNTYVTSAGFSGGTLTLTRNDAGTVTVSLDGRYYLASNPSGYITGITSGNVTTALGYTPYNSTNPNGYISSYSETDTLATVTARGATTTAAITTGLLIAQGPGGNYNENVRLPGSTAVISFNTSGATGAGSYNIVSQTNFQIRNAGGSQVFIMDQSGNLTMTGTVSGSNLSGTNTGDQTNISGTAGSISGFNNPTAAATANTIAYRDGSGDLYARYFLGGYINTSDNVDTGTITYIMAKFGDNYHRSATAAKVQSFLGLGSAAYQNTGAFLSSSGSVTINGDLTVGVGNSSNIYMNDGDEGQRQIHCNSNRIGFLTQAGAWGAYCDDSGNFFAANLSGTNTGDQTNISGNAATATNVAWTGVTGRPTAVSQFTNDSGYITGVTNISGYSGSVSIPDWRNTSYTPAQYDGNRVNWHFNNTGYNNTPPGDFWGVMQTVSPWSEFNTSHRQSQLWWGGSVGLSYRYAVGSGYTPTGWSAWETIITSATIGAQSVSYATTSGNAASVNSKTVGNGKGNIGYFDSVGNLYITNPETYTGEVRLGAAWARGGVYASSTLSMSTSSGNINFVSNDTTIGGFRWDSANGTRFIVGLDANVQTPYTLVDANKRPIMYARGAYPALVLDHTETSNTNHGPTIQFVFNGLDARQWLIGAAGNGSKLDFGMSNTAYGNTSYNPHNGIAGYTGKTVMRMTETGVLFGDCGTYPTINTASHPLQVNGTAYISSTLSMGGYIRMGVFPNSTTNAGEAWIGRASDRNAGTMTVQLGGNSASSRSFEVVDYAWSVVMFSVNSANGNVTASGDITAYSDIRVKENIVRIDSALNKIKSINGYYFNRTDVADKTKKIGFIAQEVLEVVPEIVNYNIEQDRYSISYGNTAALLVEAIKEQQLQIEELKNKLDGLTR